MAHSKTELLTPTEQRDLYGIPILNDAERQAYFTFDQTELSTLHQFKDARDAVYFAITLVFFKLKRTFIAFQYQDVLVERQHIMQRYFPHKAVPKSLPPKASKSRIDLKIIELCQANRFNGAIAQTIQDELQEIATYAPRQRQLLKELLRLFTKHNVVIPGHTTIQNLVIRAWNHEHRRVLQAYTRYTTKQQRAAILALLDETTADKQSNILTVKADLKSFHTHDLWTEIEKHAQLKAIFECAKTIMHKLNLPLKTCTYYASLIQYYNRSRMKQINPQKMGLYLLCYVFIRYQSTNDTLIDAFKKRVADTIGKANRYADEQRLKQLDQSEETRKQISAMMLMVHKRPSATISKKLLYHYIPEEQWVEAAHALVDEHFNTKLLFWKYIDSLEDSIKLGIRSVFCALDFTQVKNDALNTIIDHMKKHIEAGTITSAPFPATFHKWVDKKQRVHVIKNDVVIPNRFEFLMYMKIMHAMDGNKITFQHSVRYKNIDDEMILPQVWRRIKKPTLEKLNYSKLSTPMYQTLKLKRKESIELYRKVNEAIENGENTSVIISRNKKGERVWRLRPIEAELEPQESLFAKIRQQGVVDIITFVNQRTRFMDVFESILPKGTHIPLTIEYLSAGVLANAIRMGGRKMGDASDLNGSTLLTIEANYIFIENIRLAIDHINNQTSKFEIFEKWYINSIVHGSLDGLKLDLTFDHHKGRHSRKYFGCGLGVAGYNYIINGLSVTGNLIGAHEYEGDSTFELSTLQNTSEIKATHISTDKHGMNMFNFALFDLIDMVFMPRVPKPHREVLWGFGTPEDYEGMLIKPTKFVDEHLLIDEDDNIKRLMASFLTGHVSPTIIIKKMSSKNYSSKTKTALIHYNNMERSMHNLRMIHDPAAKHTVTRVLNRGEAYNNLYRTITLLNDGELRGKSEVEMETWHQCTRLIAAIIHYYNTYIINTLYQRATSDEERKFLEKLSPTAWTHILLLGFYQFFNKSSENWVDDFLNQWDWRKAAEEMEESQKENSKKSRKGKNTK